MAHIAFLIASPELSGGTAVIFEHALALKARGHTPTIVTPEPFDFERVRWFDRAEALNFAMLAAPGNAQFDIAVATWWQTNFDLHKIRARRYLSFVQSVESRFYPEGDLRTAFAQAAHTLSYPCITEARWIKRYLLAHYGKDAALARNGINKSIYSVEGACLAERPTDSLRILVEGSVDVPFKNVPKTVELCARARVGPIWLLTPSKGVTSYPGVERVFSAVPQAKTAEIYRSCSILVKLSLVEGMFGPPLEMFHCGGTALVYDVSGHDEYIVHEQNALVVKSGDEEEVVRSLQRFAQDSALQQHLRAGALHTARSWPSWTQAGDEFEAALLNELQRDPSPYESSEITARALSRVHQEHLAMSAELASLKEQLASLKEQHTELSRCFHILEEEGNRLRAALEATLDRRLKKKLEAVPLIRQIKRLAGR